MDARDVFSALSLRPLRLCVIISLCLALLLSVAVFAQHKKKALPAKPIDLNTATVEELQQLPEIGPARAQAIVHFRERSGPFRRVEDLLAVRGISKRILEKIRPYVFVAKKEKKKQGG